MSDQLPPLDENLRALLDAAVPPSPSADFEARVLARLDASLALPPGPGGGHGGGPSGAGGAPAAGAAATGGLVTLGKTTLALAGLVLAA
ncbi:MAG: hypothetical protein K1X89_16710, partial [Myxococcaceae bacterium]|nr:hypothetical protein [Myxococcaceae bacterium]